MEKNNVLNPDSGVYNPLLRFAFTNITEEPFEIRWNGEHVTTVQKDQTVELPHHLAVVCTKQLVDKIMIANAKLSEIEFYQKNPNMQSNSFRASSSLGVPSARKVWEDRICRVMEVDEESPQVQIMRAQIKAELQADLSAQPSQGSPLDNAPKSISEFADLTKKEEKEEKQSSIKVRTVGRPPKVKQNETVESPAK
jgi:hypothetical protein